MVNPNKDNSGCSSSGDQLENGQTRRSREQFGVHSNDNGENIGEMHLATNDDIDDDEDLKNRFTHVRVLHDFRGSNNDELCMKKDDIITLTQTPSGGWWEGTLDGITGWFPSNYVQPIDQSDPLYQQLQLESGATSEMLYSSFYPGTSSGPASDSGQQQWQLHPHSPQDSMILLAGGSDHLAEYRSIVMKVIEDSETQFIQSLQDAINHYLMPIYQFKILPSETELNAVLRSITEICTVHRRFLNSIEKIKNIPYKDNRIGGLFMQYAPQFKHAHFEYCSHHAKFVHVIEKYKKEICQFFSASQQPLPASVAQTLASPSHQAAMAGQNLASMANVQITSLLSVSFRRLDKYPALLQELQRYTEENHADRGDIQRAGFLYREISMSCLELRRRKEMELEVMLGNIKNFDRLNIETYGQIIKMEPVSILIVPNWHEPKKDCYLVLFPKVLMILSVGKEMTSFTFESMMKLEGAKLQPINLPADHRSSSGPGSFCQLYPMEISGQNAHPFPPDGDPHQSFTYVVGFASEEPWKEYYQVLQKQIRHQTAPSALEQQQQSSASMSMSSTSASLVQQSGSSASSSASSSSAAFSPQSTSISITSPDQPAPTNLPPKPPQYRIQQHADAPPMPPPHHHRPPPPVPPLLFQQPMNIDALCHSLPKPSSYWTDQMLTPHTPYRPMDSINGTSMASSSGANMDSSQTNVSGVGNAASNEDQTNDDMQLLNVIDAYHRKFPSGSRGSAALANSRKISADISDQSPSSGNNQLELEPYQYVEIVGRFVGSNSHLPLQRNPSTRNARKNSLTMLANKINKLSLSSMDRDVLYEIYDQLRVIRNEMSHLSEKVREERRQRKRLQHSLAKKAALVAAAAAQSTTTNG